MYAIARVVTFLVSFVLIYQPAIEVVLRHRALEGYRVGALEAFVPSEAEASLPPGTIPLRSPLQLTRTQSAYSIDTTTGGEITLSYHAVNVGTEEVRDPLLVTELAPGATLLESTPAAEVSGQTLAVVLPSVPMSEMATATLRISLPPGGAPLTVDGGATVFGSLLTREASDTIDPTVLPQSIGVDETFLEPTPDARAEDVDTLRYVAEVGCDGGDIFAFVRDRVAYEAYRGSLRGSRGTVWSMAGNALDQASLLIAMLRACGIPARYATGTLDASRSKELIRSMFPEPLGIVGALDSSGVPGLDLYDELEDAIVNAPGASEISDPENDPEMMETASRHAWVELWDGASFIPADPTFATSSLGDTFTSTSQTFAEIPNAMRHRVRFQLVEEEYPVDMFNAILAAAYHIDPSDELVRNGVKPVGDVFVQEIEVLDHTVATVDLVGETVSFGHYVEHMNIFSTVEFVFNTYSPWMKIGNSDELIRGTDYQEAMATIVVDLAKFVTGLYVRMTTIDPDGNEMLYEHVAHDRFGLAQRLGEEPVGPPDWSREPFMIDLNTIDISLPVSDIDHRIPAEALARSEAAAFELQDRFPTAQTDDLGTYPDDDIRDIQELSRESFQAVNQFDLAAMSALWDATMSQVEGFTGTRSYLAEPQIFVTSSYVRERESGELAFGQRTDLRKHDSKVIPYPGEPMSTAFLARAASGQTLSILETAALARQADPGATALGAMDILGESADQGIPLRMISDGNQLEIDELDLSAEARLRIRMALDNGKSVVVPAAMVTIDGTTTTAWIETDMTTGDTIAVTEDGGYQGAIDYAAILRCIGAGMLGMLSETLGILGALVNLYIDLPAKKAECERKGNCAMVGMKALGGTLFGIFCGWGLTCAAAGLAGGPPGWIVSLIFVFLCALVGVGFAAILDDIAGDPPLSAYGARRFVRETESLGTGEVSATATLPTGAGAVTGTVDADHTRISGEIDAAHLLDPTLGSLSLFPTALVGLGAGGFIGEGLNYDASTIASGVDSTLNLDYDTGSLSITGATLAGDSNVGFTGFDGAIDATDAGDTDTTIVDGTYDRALFVELNQATATASHDTPASFQTTLHSNADDDYLIQARAPAGWTVEVSATGLVEFTPPFGEAPGSYEVRISASSEDLEAEAVAIVDVSATTAAGLAVQFVEDEIYNVPQHGTYVFSNYRLEVYNGGLVDDVFDITVSGPPASDFTVAASAIAIPAGETGFVGVAFHPVGGLLPAGTQVALSGTATGRGTALTGNASATFTYPDVYGVIPSFDPEYIYGYPGDSVPVDLILTGTGNGPSTFALDVTSAYGLGVSGIPASTTVDAGETVTLPVSVSIPAGAAVGTPAAITVVADLCNGVPFDTCMVPLPAVRPTHLAVSVGVPEAMCLFDAAQASLDGPDLTVARAVALFGRAISELEGDPTDIALQNRAIAAGNEVLLFLVAADLQATSTALGDALAEFASGDSARVDAAIDSLCTVLAALPAEMEAESDAFNYGFTIGLAPASAVVQPGDPAVYNLRLASTGTQSTPIDLSLVDLPPGVSGSLSQASVTLAPGEVLDENSPTPVTATLTSPTPISGDDFQVDALVSSKPSITSSTTGLFSAVEGAIDVVVVTPNPTAVQSAGSPLNVSVDLLNRVNQARDVLVAWRIEDPTGTLLFTGTPVAARVGTGGGTTTVPLGAVDTTGFPDGNHNIIALVTTPASDPIPGRSGLGVFFVGLPFSAYAMATPALVPPGSTEAVTSSVIVAPESIGQVGSFADQFADSVVSSTSVTDEANALGPPQGDVATLPIGAVLIVDMGTNGERIGDGSGDDLVVFERDPEACTLVHEFEYEVAVSDSPTGPFTVLGSPSGDRFIGDGFDLASVGLSSARYVRITSTEDEIGIDAVLAAHTVSPNHIQIEHHSPLGEETGVASTPVVGDVDQDGNPEVYFVSQTGGAQCEAFGIDGVTKAQDFHVTYVAGCNGGLGSCFCGNSSSPAIGDINGDGNPNILLYQTVLNNRRLRAFEADGTEIYSLDVPRDASSISPIFENLDGDPEPEILWLGGYLEQDGTMPMNNALGNQPIALDVDDDGTQELIQRINWGNLRALEADGTQVWNANINGLTADLSRPAVADLNADGKPNLVVMHSRDGGTNRKLTALNAEDGSILWENTFPDAVGTCANDGSPCGPGHPPCPGFFNSCSTTLNLSGAQTTPTIADLDGDGEPEVAAFIRAWDVTDDHVVVFEADGTFKWSTAAIDPGGTPPGLSSADLNGDGKSEVIWNGWCDGFTLLDGTTGAILYRDPRAASASGGEHSTAADVDNDGHVEVATGGVTGMYIFGADLDWGPGRSIWNDLDYHVTSVEDDLTIPTLPAKHWLADNNFRSQIAGSFAGASASVVVTHDLAGSFSFDPGDITPAPSLVNGVVEWDETVTSLTSFDVPGTVPPLMPGESIVVSDSSSVVGTLTLDGGLVVNLTIPLGPTTVAAPHIIDLTPEAQTVSAGTAADFTVHVENLRTTSETFTLSVVGFEAADVTLAPSVVVAPGTTSDVPLSLATAPTAPAGQMDFLVIATGDQGTTDQVFGTVHVTPNAILPLATGRVLVEVDPALKEVGKGSTTSVNVKVTNLGSMTETFDMTSASAAGIVGTFADPALTVAPGLSAARTTQLILEIPASIATGTSDYDVAATAQSNPGFTGMTTATVDVPPYGVIVEMSPDTASVTPTSGATFTALITNPGTGTASFDLELLGPLAPFACFDTPFGCAPTDRQTIFGGRDRTVTIHLGAFPNIPQQQTFLGMQATGSNILNGIVISDMDYSLIDVTGERGVEVEADPTVLNGDTLAPAPFSLRITNTGNLCDERYTLTFSSTPSGVDILPDSTTFIVPGGRTAVVGAYALAPAFGTYDINVHIETDAANPLCPTAAPQSDSTDLTLILSGGNVAPVADAGADQDAAVGTPVFLDGTGSFDPDGGTLTFVWTFQSVPAGSALTSADILGAGTATPSFTPDVPGDYVLALDVSDSVLNDGDTMTVTATASPIADAGPDQQVVTGDPVQHDASASYDPDGDFITFSWSVVAVPGGSSVTVASLSDAADAKPTFTPDVDGDYTFEVTVSDGLLTDTDTVVITSATGNVAPVADAGPSQGTVAGTAITLDASASFDPDSGPAPLGFLWSILEQPAGSSATDADILDRTTDLATFTPDVVGTFVIGLEVDDGDRTSMDYAEVLAGASNIPPVADAGDDAAVVLGGSPLLDGRDSDDADDAPAPLTFMWRFVAVPAGSSLTNVDLRDADTDSPSFTPDARGTFVLRLKVSDGLDTHEDNVAVEVESRPGLNPVADVWLRRGSRAINEGASAYLVVRGDTSRILIKFDLAEIQAELGGKDLASAHLELTINGPDAQGWKNGKDLGAYRMTEPWTEGNGFHYRVRPLRNRTRGVGEGSTWWCGTDTAIENDDRDCSGTDWRMKPLPRNNRNNLVNPWVDPPTDAVTIQNQQTGTVILDVTDDVQAWLDGEPNLGWAVLKEPKTGGGTLWLDSREGPEPPRLVVVPAP